MKDSWFNQMCAQKEAHYYNLAVQLNMIKNTDQDSTRLIQIAYDEDNLSEDMVSFNRQQFLALQFLIQNKQLKKQAQNIAQCTVQAKKKEQMRIQRQIEAEKQRIANKNKKKIITIEQRINAQKKIDINELLTQIEKIDQIQIKSTQHENRYLWLNNSHVLGF